MELATKLEKKSESSLQEGIERIQRLVAEIEKVIVGQTPLIFRIIVALLADPWGIGLNG